LQQQNVIERFGGCNLLSAVSIEESAALARVAMHVQEQGDALEGTKALQ